MGNPFAAWIKQAGLTKHAVALAWGVQDPAIWKLTRDGHRPSRRNLMRIWRFTGGEVTPDDMLLAGEKHRWQPSLAKNSPEHKNAVKAIRAAKKERANAKKAKKRKPGTQAGRAEQRPE